MSPMELPLRTKPCTICRIAAKKRQPMASPRQSASMCVEQELSSCSGVTSRNVSSAFPGPMCVESETSSRSALNRTLSILEAEAAQFALRAINESKVRLNYLKEIKTYSREIANLVKTGQISVHEGHLLAQQMRGTILEASRLKSSEIGRAYAEGQKAVNRTLEDLYQKYSQKLFKIDFDKLTIDQRNKVKLEIIESAGRDSPKTTKAAQRIGKLGKGLWVLTIGLAVYNVSTAEDKLEATAKEGSTILGGIGGGAAAGAATGLVCGPGAVVCSSVLVIAGGALGALGMEYVFDWIWK